MTRLKLQVEWPKEPPRPDVSSPDDATEGFLRIDLAGHPITRNRPRSRRAPGADDFVSGPMCGLADWIVEHWMAILWETHTPFPKANLKPSAEGSHRVPGLRDAHQGWKRWVKLGIGESSLAEWQRRHTLGLQASEIALPSVVFVAERDDVGIAVDYPPVWGMDPAVIFDLKGDFTPGEPIWVPKKEIEATLAKFVNEVLDRARPQKCPRLAVWHGWLQRRWQGALRGAQDECQRLAMDIGPAAAKHWDELSAELDKNTPALRGILTDSTVVTQIGQLQPLVNVMNEAAPAVQNGSWRKVHLRSSGFRTPPYAQGYELAQRARKQLGVGSAPLGEVAIALRQLGINAHAAAVGNLFRSAAFLTPDGPAAVVFSDNPSEPINPNRVRFALAAAAGRLLAEAGQEKCFGAAHSEQSRWRETQRANAFAAEFLLPAEAIADALASGAKEAGLSETYGISRSATHWHINNRTPDLQAESRP